MFALRSLLAPLLAFCLLGIRSLAQDEMKKPPPEPWQVAGIRAAFGDARAPFPERSVDVRREALKLAEAKGWGAALEPQSVLIYLNSSETSFRLQVISALGQMGKEGGRFAKELAESLTVKCPDGERSGWVAMGGTGADEVAVYWRTVEALVQQEKDGAQIATAIAPLLQHNGSDVRRATFAVLEQIGAQASPSAEQTAALLRSADAGTRADTAKILGKIESVPRPSTPDASEVAKIAQRLKDEGEFVSVESTDALVKLGQAAPALAKEIAALLEDRDANVRLAAATTLGKLGQSAAEFAPRLAALLADGDIHPPNGDRTTADKEKNHAPSFEDLYPIPDHKIEVRAAAARALGKTGNAGATYASRLVDLLADDDRDIRSAAAEGLASMTRSGVPVRELIVDLLNENNDAVADGALEALDDIGLSGAEAPKVVALLQRPDRQLRCHAVGSLAKLGKAGAKFATEVAALLIDPEMDVLEEAFFKKEEAWKAKHAHRTGKDLATEELEPRENPPKAVLTSAFLYAAVLEALDQWGNPKGDLELQAAMLSAAPNTGPSPPHFRAHLRLWAGDDAEMQRSVSWLGGPDIEPMPEQGLSPEENRATLALFAKLWDHSVNHPRLRKELVERITQIAKGITAKPDEETRKVLQELANKLGEPNPAAHAEVERAMTIRDLARGR